MSKSNQKEAPLQEPSAATSWFSNPLNYVKREQTPEIQREPTPPTPEPPGIYEKASNFVKSSSVYSTVSETLTEKAEAIKTAVVTRTNSLKQEVADRVDKLPQQFSETAVATAASTAVMIKQSPIPGLLTAGAQKLEEISHGAAVAAGGQGLVEVAAAESARLAIKLTARAVQAGRYVVKTGAKAGLEAYVAWQTSPSYEQLNEMKAREKAAQQKYGKMGMVRDEAGWHSDGSSPRKSSRNTTPKSSPQRTPVRQGSPKKKPSSDWSSDAEELSDVEEEVTDQGITSRVRSTLGSALDNVLGRSRSSSVQPSNKSSPRKKLFEDDLSYRPLTKTDTVKINVGGQVFATKVGTLFSANKDSKLSRWFREGNRQELQVVDGAFFIDRDGTHFRQILNWLRDKDTIKSINDARDLREIRTEAEYYELWELADQIADQVGDSKSDRQATGVASSISLTSLLSSLISDGTEQGNTRPVTPTEESTSAVATPAMSPRRKRDIVKDLVTSSVEYLKK